MKKLLFVFTLCILSTSMVWGVDYLINEGFEGTTFPPTGWTNNGCVNSSNNPKTGSKDLCFNGANDNIYTPKLVDPYILSFWYRRSSKSTAWTLNIQISTDASNWTSIGTITSVTTTYQEFTYNLSSYSNIYIRLLDQRSTGTNERYVDDFTVTKQVSNPIIEISTTTLTGFSYVQGSGPSSTKTFTISGSNLTANISINAPTDYEISTSSDGTYGSSLTLNQSKGSVSETTIYVRLKAGLSAGNYNNENITASSTGATDKTVTCSGTVSSPPPPNAPTANAATSVSYNKFTANWNSVSGATKYYLDVYTKGANATDLIISEYVEGSGNNKAIELYNGTGSSINLSNYSLKKQVNGDGEFVNELTLSGTLANGDTYVIVSNAGTTNLADSNFVNLETNSQALSFNGNDAVALYKNSERTQTQIDVVGVVDQTADWGKDVTLVRKSSVTSPTTSYNTEQWNSYAQDTFTYLGSHTMASGNSYVSGYQDKDVGNVTSYEVSGLEGDKTYYYVVRAYNEYGSSANSNEISVTTTSATLPVELSAFTANINSQGGITLMWVTQSETGVNGFYVNRAMVNDLAIAERISPLIPGSNTSHQQVYVYSDKEVYEPGTYYYWLEIQDIDGVVNYYGSRSVTFGGNGNNGTPDIPLVTGIRSIYPNPFNPSATIMYELEQPANVNIDIYNNRGQIVRSFAIGQKEKGSHKLLWDGTDNSGSACGTGIYFIKMQAGKETFVKKAALVK